MADEAKPVERAEKIDRIKTSRGDTVALLMEVASDEELDTFHASLLATDIVTLNWKSAAAKREQEWMDRQSKLGGMPDPEQPGSTEAADAKEAAPGAKESEDAQRRKELMERMRKLVQVAATLAKDAPVERLEAAIPKFEQAAIALRGPKNN